MISPMATRENDMKNGLEYRRVDFDLSNIECREDSDKGTYHISGLAVVFNQKTRIRSYWEEFDEVIDARAFDEADMSDVALFVNHNQKMVPLARVKRGKGTLMLEVRADGLYISTDLDVPGNPSAAELYSALKRGDIDKMSFAFSIRSQKWDNLNEKDKMPIRTVLKIDKLYEVSAVTYPAYEGTDLSARGVDGLDKPHCQALVDARAASADADASALELAKAKARAMSIL